MKEYFMTENAISTPDKKSDYSNLLGHRWPGVQLYYPPIKYMPKENTYESEEAAIRRFEKYALTTKAHTLLFDLEDGCQKKDESRALLRKVAGRLAGSRFQVAIRINCFLSEEYKKDLELIKDIGGVVDAVMLAKAGENYGLAEIRDLSSELMNIDPELQIQPIIEHPLSLKIAAQLMNFSSVKHVVFGIHDFSKAMGISISPEGWLNELKSWLHLLLLEARLHGSGVIGGVDTLINRTVLPDDYLEKEQIEGWVENAADYESSVVYRHAVQEASMGLTGKQVIHPNHINLCRAAFHPIPTNIKRAANILRKAAGADAFRGGAIRYEDEMLDPPMFGKAVQTLLRANALNVIKPEESRFLREILPQIPAAMLREIWPFV